MAALVGTTLLGASLLGRWLERGPLTNLVGMAAGLALAFAILILSRSLPAGTAVRLLFSRKGGELVLLITGITLLSGALQCPSPAGALVEVMRDELMALRVPLVVVIALIPFISGVVTGIAMGFVGTSFPLIFALLGQDPSAGAVISTTVLAFGFGYAGMMLSPVHICFVVTCQYFGTTIFKSYRYLLGPVAAIAVAAVVMAALYRKFL